MKNARTVEDYIVSKKEWSEALLLLREILGSTSLEEAIQNHMDGKEIKPMILEGIGLYDKYKK